MLTLIFLTLELVCIEAVKYHIGECLIIVGIFGAMALVQVRDKAEPLPTPCWPLCAV